MGTVDSPQPSKEQKGKGLKRPKKRIGIRIDMTPMVDIAFLLLIFYMVTTVFAAPQAMEINLPEDTGESVPVKTSNLLVLRVDDVDTYWWSHGKEGPVQFKQDSLRTLLFSKNRENARLNTLIIIHSEAKYNDFVEILDEIEVIEFVLRDDDEFMDYYREANKDVLDSTGTFSYRYSTKPWDKKDENKIKKARSSSLLGGDDS